MVTIELNERTKAGKLVLELVKFLSEEKGIKIVQPDENLEPNEETKRILEETDQGQGVEIYDSVEDLLKVLNS